MGNKKKRRKKLNSLTSKKYKTRSEFLLSQFPECILDIWFGDNKEKRNAFGKYLIKIEEKNSEDSLYSLRNDELYEDKLEKMFDKKSKNLNKLLLQMKKYRKMKKKYNKLKDKSKYNKDLSIASYLDSSRYAKKYINKIDYRKKLKKIVKAEKKELSEMRELGYIKNIDVDKELKRLKKADDAMKYALSDAYVQKHFLT